MMFDGVRATTIVPGGQISHCVLHLEALEENAVALIGGKPRVSGLRKRAETTKAPRDRARSVAEQAWCKWLQLCSDVRLVSGGGEDVGSRRLAPLIY